MPEEAGPLADDAEDEEEAVVADNAEDDASPDVEDPELGPGASTHRWLSRSQRRPKSVRQSSSAVHRVAGAVTTHPVTANTAMVTTRSIRTDRRFTGPPPSQALDARELATTLLGRQGWPPDGRAGLPAA